MKIRNLTCLLLAALLIFACNLPSAVAPGLNSEETATAMPRPGY